MDAPFPAMDVWAEGIAVNTSKCREVRPRSELATEMEVVGFKSQGEANCSADLVEGSTGNRDDGTVGGETGARSSAVAAIDLLDSDEDDATANADANAIGAPADADDGDFWPLATQLPLSEASLPVLHQECGPYSSHELFRKLSAAPNNGLHVSQAATQAPAAAAAGIVELASAVPLGPVVDGGAGRSPPRGLDHPCEDECGEEAYACNQDGGTDDGGMRKDDDWQPWLDAPDHELDAAAGFGSEPAPGNRDYAERRDPQPDWFVGNGEAVGCVEELEEAGDEREPKLNEDDYYVDDDDGGDDGDPVAAWLYRHGLQRWLSRFQDGEVDEAVVPELNDADLQGLGIDSPRARVAILAAARDFGAAAAPTVVELPQASGGGIQTSPGPHVTFAAPSFPDGADPPILRYPVGQQLQVSNALVKHYYAATGFGPEPQNLQKQQHKQREEQQLDQQLEQQRQQRQQFGQQQDQGPCEQRVQGSAMEPHTAPPAAQPVAAAGSAQPFASMFLTKPSGPVRITNFFRVPGATAGGSGTESSPTAAAAGIAASWGRAVQQHALVLPKGQQQQQQPWQQQQQHLARRHPQQLQPHPQQLQRPGAVAGGGAGGGGGPVGRLPRWVPECHTIPGTRWVLSSSLLRASVRLYPSSLSTYSGPSARASRPPCRLSAS
ncbi:hypothetical protein Vafri_11958 [Volvox africanus]|uniref:SAM domain-containing protein n=1 Tax=Volvox africanus TaxID=51714 RepID=A0A8J4BA25_9CHLO|nr:hypothetical protein Vafri_11958 [Volvox africanus]